jgi:hypothetical protein
MVRLCWAVTEAVIKIRVSKGGMNRGILLRDKENACSRYPGGNLRIAGLSIRTVLPRPEIYTQLNTHSKRAEIEHYTLRAVARLTQRFAATAATSPEFSVCRPAFVVSASTASRFPIA